MGFILKDRDGAMEEAVRLLRAGVQSGEEGTQDGRFYLHLGDLLIRLGRTDEVHYLGVCSDLSPGMGNLRFYLNSGFLCFKRP